MVGRDQHLTGPRGTVGDEGVVGGVVDPLGLKRGKGKKADQ